MERPLDFLWTRELLFLFWMQNHMLELYDRHPPPLAQNSSKLVKTVSGEDLPIQGILRTTITIAGGNYPCEFKAIEGVTYRGVLEETFCVLPVLTLVLTSTLFS
ncbi:hypothetical protein OS493_010501 [Desmophyllum pertusum]|uniref:Uncharacterized protein n=1 Tax=Desmophyllum pertusum TaxID=174260 RepID=A0A9X0A3M4_9CNID|nr:hypothetical protein OS493_010501 [Desmophyllum pertusum]